MTAPEAGRPGPRVALVHDFLSQLGGAERVVLELSRLFPDAPIFTSFYRPEATFEEFSARRVVPSYLQKVVPADRFRRYALLYPGALARFDLDDFDLVIASSSAFGHRVRHPNCHVYCHTPPRFLYQAASYAHRRWQHRLLDAGTAPLRRADRASARAKASYAANSQLTRRRVRDAYGIESRIIHPPLAVTGSAPLRALPDRPSLLMVARLLPYKRVDLAIEVANATGLPLTVVGDGPELPRLAAMAGPSVRLLGRVPDDELADLFAAASLVLVPGAEDFGYGPVEAHWFGRPVVASAAGGALETVADGDDGFLVADADPASWTAAVTAALEREWSPSALRAAAAPFTPSRFRHAVLDWLGLADGRSGPDATLSGGGNDRNVGEAVAELAHHPVDRRLVAGL
ncbi:MAG: glycosyltransferase [Acidimicrobiales bacterium]